MYHAVAYSSVLCIQALLKFEQVSWVNCTFSTDDFKMFFSDLIISMLFCYILPNDRTCNELESILYCHNYYLFTFVSASNSESE